MRASRTIGECKPAKCFHPKNFFQNLLDSPVRILFCWFVLNTLRQFALTPEPDVSRCESGRLKTIRSLNTMHRADGAARENEWLG